MQTPTEVTVALPRHLNLAALRSIRATWPATCGAVNIVLHPEQWVEPTGLVGLACLIEEGRRSGLSVDVVHQGCSRGGYWERMGFFRQVGLPPPSATGLYRDGRRRFAEIRKIDDINFVDDITEELVSVAVPGANEMRTFSHIVSELMNNVCQHSGASGFSAAQYWPGSDLVQFCIADFGCGLKNALQGLYNPTDDGHAIDLALRVGVTGRPPHFGQPHMRNRGVGLSCAHRLAAANNGRFELWSGNAIYSAEGVTIATPERWTGTLVAVTMQRSKLAADFRAVMNDLTAELYEVERLAKAATKGGSQ